MEDKQFIQNFENKVKNIIEKYNLIEKKDKIIVACSGGKDSTTLLYLLNKFGYHVEGIFIDLHLGNYSKINLMNLRSFCKKNKIKLHVFSFRDELGYSVCYMKSILKSKNVILSSCNICGILRRWLLNRKTRELKATKLVTGHNLDDEVETIMMNIFNGNINLLTRIGPDVGVVRHKKFVPRIKPLYFVTNAETTKYSKLMKFPVLYDKCPCSTDAHRGNFRNFIKDIEITYPEVKTKIINSFLEILPEMREFYKTDKKINYCKICGEPTSSDVCNACNIFKKLNKNDFNYRFCFKF